MTIKAAVSERDAKDKHLQDKTIALNVKIQQPYVYCIKMYAHKRIMALFIQMKIKS